MVWNNGFSLNSKFDFKLPFNSKKKSDEVSRIASYFCSLSNCATISDETFCVYVKITHLEEHLKLLKYSGMPFYGV